MADIAAVLKKTIDGLPRHDAAIRAKVYDKARIQIRSKLLTAKPDADQATVDRNMAVVERAIRAVEDDYRFQDELGSVLGAEEADHPAEPMAADETTSAEAVSEPPAEEVAEERHQPAQSPEETPHQSLFGEPEADEPPPTDPALADEAPEPQPDPFEAEAPRADEPSSPLDEVTADTSESVSVAPPHDGAQTDAALTDVAAETEAFRRDARSRPHARKARAHRPRRWGLAAVAAIVLLLAGGAGAVAYFMPDAFDEQLARLETSLNDFFSEEDDVTSISAEPETRAPVASPESPSGTETEAQRPQKFTQRLRADGSETDAGPAGGPVDEFGEGTSVAPLTVAQAESEAPAAGASADNGEEPTAEEAQPAVQVGQRAIYSEERTANEQLRRLQGSVVWTQVQEQPGPNMDEEPAIRADLYIPDTGTSMRMTLRRNGDPSLPASHVLELIFEPTTKEPGRGVREILRMMFKETEAAQGDPLRAFPAEIGGNFFMMMLDEGQQARQSNLDLIRNRDWIDLLVVLEAGRRALFTMEKGLPGAKIVDEVLDHWQTHPLPET